MSGSGSAPLAEVEAALTGHFGATPARASMSFVGVDPIEVLRFGSDRDEIVFASLGMSRRPMIAPSARVHTEDGPRAEILLRVHDAGLEGPVWRRVALLAAAPTVEGVVYAAGMTIDLGEPLVMGSRCTGAVIAESSLPDVASAVGPVAILDALPATSAELAWSRVNGAAALRGRWRECGVDLRDLQRRAVALD